MKKIIFLLLTLFSVQAFAQQLTSYNFSGDGYDINAGFPRKPSKNFSGSSNSRTLTLTAADNGITYALVITKTGSAQIASQSVQGTVDKLWNKAGRRDVQQQSTVAGVSSTLLKYVSEKGAYVISHTFASGLLICQAMVIQQNSYAADYSANNFFYAVNFSSSNNNNQTYNPPANNNYNNRGSYRLGDKAEVYYPKDGKWYACTIKAVYGNSYLIGYDGYASSWDETVGTDRLRQVSGNSNQQNNNPSGNNYPTAGSGSWQKNQRVEVWDGKSNKWFGAIVLKVNSNNTYRISYDGYAENYDEDVAADKIRNMTLATAPANIPYIELKKYGYTKVEGNLASGYIMQDLSWATTSQMACWPSIRDIEFQGKHVAYWFDVPEKSVVKITVTPKHNNRRINIYGYSGFDLRTTPPAVVFTNVCEASHPAWIGQPNLNEPAKPQTIEFNTTTRRTIIYFAVAGARNVYDGEYTIKIDVD